MTLINRSTLLTDTKLYLGNANTLSDVFLSNINENVILKVGDDNTKYSEVLCKSLNVAGVQNRAFAAADGAGGVKRTKVGPIEEEFYQGSAVDGWDQYISDLTLICPMLPGGGYELYKGVGITVSPGDEIDVNDTPSSGSSNLGLPL